MRVAVFLWCLLAATAAAAGSFECTLDGAPWKTKAPLIFVSSTEGPLRLYLQVNSNRAPSLSLAVDWELLNGPGKAAVELGASDGGPAAISGIFSERYEKPVPTPEGMASAERRRVRVIGGTLRRRRRSRFRSPPPAPMGSGASRCSAPATGSPFSAAREVGQRMTHAFGTKVFARSVRYSTESVVGCAWSFPASVGITLSLPAHVSPLATCGRCRVMAPSSVS